MPTDAEFELLLIEDTEADALLIRRRLEQAGLSARTRRVDRMKALTAALDEQSWSALLYDYTVPGLHFDDTIELLRARCPEIPIILVSGTVSEEMAVKLLQYGLNDFVLKDNLLRLPSVIRRAVDNAGERARRKTAESELRKLAMVVEQSPTSIVITNTVPAIEYVNQAFIDNTGYSRAEVLGSNPSILNQGLTPAGTYTDLWETLSRGEVWKGEFRNTRKDGSTYMEMATIAPIRDPGGEITHYVAVKSDVTDLRRSESRVHQLANFDDLTGLPNRSLLLDRLEQAARSSQRTARHGMILALDIDGFKFINDIHGYQVGNQVLISIAERLRETLTDDSTIARIGGNRFAIVVENLSRRRDQAAAQAHDLAELIHEELQIPHVVEQAEASIRHATTMGLYLITSEREEADRLLNKAEIALQRARDDARNTWRFFNSEMQTLVESRARIEAGLHEALEQDHLNLFFQSQFDARGRLTGAEGLIRWNRPGEGRIPPDQFIPLAEETGLILPIGSWVLDTACQCLKTWSTNPRTQGLHLSINVSARQFHQPRFIDLLLEALDQYQISPGRLSLELTESVVLNDLSQTEQRMLAVRDLGIGLALDDFGTGFSSLSYLKHLPFDTLKIDRSFVSDMIATASSAAIIRATIAMGHALGLTVIAEGVETQEEWALLKDFGCDAFQGFLFARPVSNEEWKPTDFSVKQA
ncbi:putative bifunctional diguanylate cyclase/phosphodiesterase [Wenzhouxiangella limi]|uniref:EAL domain-containing protein n=1 Tax=Wenzhouxiangella limi TaxID=2707351 RepID=A0A845V0A2_9GAMM|nr:EAL domain-containing protein [Wenzhouxiangella limi]NDY95630.1 EAL domain-containing protein [Wenzhouxiangella limi]